MNQPIENLNNLDLVVVNLKQIYETVLVLIDPSHKKKMSNELKDN